MSESAPRGESEIGATSSHADQINGEDILWQANGHNNANETVTDLRSIHSGLIDHRDTDSGTFAWTVTQSNGVLYPLARG